MGQFTGVPEPSGSKDGSGSLTGSAELSTNASAPAYVRTRPISCHKNFKASGNFSARPSLDSHGKRFTNGSTQAL